MAFPTKIDGTFGNDFLVASDPNLDHDIAGMEGDDTVGGGNGSDTIYGDKRDGYGLGNDYIEAGAGNDVVYGGYGQDQIYGQDGNDIIYGSTTRPDVVLSEYDHDYIDGGAGADTVYGGGGNDTVFGGSGKDILIGEDGKDIIFGEDDEDSIDGGAGNDTLSGGAGNDYIYGGAGDDVLSGDAGADRLEGGDGFDVASYTSSSAGITLNLLNTSLNTGDAAGDGYASIEAFQGSNYNDVMRAASTGSVLHGMNGNDSMYGHLGNDVLSGGFGNDFMQAGPGNDTVYGGAGDDVYGFTAYAGYDWIVENANEGTDILLMGPDISQVSLDRAGNNLVFFANGSPDNVAIIADWFVNKAVEYLQLADGSVYSIADLVNAYIPSANVAQNSLAAAGTGNFDAGHAFEVDFSDIPTVDVAGISGFGDMQALA